MRRRVCRSLLAAIGLLLADASVANAQQEAQEVPIRVTAIGEDTVVLLADAPVLGVGAENFLAAGDPLTVSVEGGQPPAVLLYAADARFGVLLQQVSVGMQLRPDGGVAVLLPEGSPAGGFVDIYSDRDQPPATLVVPGAVFVLSRGSMRAVRNADGGVTVTVGSGRANVLRGEGDQAASGPAPIILQAEAQNQVSVSAAGEVSPATRGEGLNARMLTDRGLLVQQSLLPELVRVAEAVAEGDIEPPTRGSVIAAVSVAPVVRLTEIVPRGGLATQIVAGTQRGFAPTAVQSTAQEFLTSSQAALAVVGSRLQRTRIVGAVAGRPLTISQQLAAPFRLGRVLP